MTGVHSQVCSGSLTMQPVLGMFGSSGDSSAALIITGDLCHSQLTE